MIVVVGSDALAAALDLAFPELRVARVAGEGAVSVEAGGEVLDLGPDPFAEDPRPGLERVCAFLGVAYDQALLGPFEAERRGDAGSEPLGSVSTTSFAETLRAAGASVLVSTYQAGKLVTARAAPGGGLNTHFRDVDKPMGLAVAPGRMALGTRTEVWDLRDLPAAATGGEDACYLLRKRHVTGDIAVHDLAFNADGELWLVATAFSCLATLDGDHSFVPRWTPPQVTRLAAEDRCHLNGLAMRDGRPAYVTALGSGDAAGSWRDRRADGGVLLDVATGATVTAGLSMPHSPRWHGGRLWVLESGRGTLATVDLATGALTVVAELPGFTRGLAFLGHLALVGLSQIRESSTFGGLPLAERLRERRSGVWVVDVRTGAVTAFLQFEDLVQEVYDVTVLPHAFPEVGEPAGQTVASSFALP